MARPRTLVLVASAVLIAAAVFMLPRFEERSAPGEIRLGAPADTGGLLATRVAEVAAQNRRYGRTVVVYPLKDCCTSKAEWALSADLLDAAIMCPDAAERLVARDERYLRRGVVLVNSDLMAVGEDHVEVVGVARRRRHQVEAARTMFGDGVRVQATLASTTGFALESGKVDAAVVDALDARWLDDVVLKPLSVDGIDIPTYELVVRRDFAESAGFKGFLDALATAAEQLNQPSSLNRAVTSMTGTPLTPEEVEQWQRMRIRFLPPNN